MDNEDEHKEKLAGSRDSKQPDMPKEEPNENKPKKKSFHK